MEEKNNSKLPPGFRFHPTDEELVVHYLRNQVLSLPCPVSIIPEVDIYKFDPWQLPVTAEFGENERYFFSPRDRKYPNGIRPNRATVSGYWKATGTDKAIHSGAKFVGIKKSLVFYHGRPPKGTKTDWIMHEYRMSESRVRPVNQHGSSMRLDNWVLYRIYKKRRTGQKVKEADSYDQTAMITSTNDSIKTHEPPPVLTFPRTSSLAHLLSMGYLDPITHLINDGNPFDSWNFNPNDNGKEQWSDVPRQFGDSTGTVMTQGSGLNQQLYIYPKDNNVSFF
ncbi:hypothetical protein Nepgr_033014 [Nepenthes gracilis]|uniref:NAC domain-containing protein n=1 Tax=Nepenthes gracilis TaxID=150966 RepID=A0AAD3Y8Q9_NEPGR|nr:hypothetical protein Nepgr_033014 [Nepenthes gracilis]